jgi:cellulose synthase/poly-beta-1,6-N-acetylglucosamine synthase-like glycosyltransferase
MKKYSVTIIIPAHNEEANIHRLLGDVLAQRDYHFILKKILVLSDGSTDQTAKRASQLSDPRILVKEYTKRMGKVYRVNTALKAAKTDILIQFDADIRLNNKYVVEKLIKPFISDPTIGMVCGSHVPLAPKTFIERVGQFGERCWSKAVSSLGSRGGLYRCYGHVRAMSKAYYAQFQLPLLAGSAEDTYSFYFAMQQGYKVIYAPDAQVSYRLPSTFGDYIKQMTRFQNEKSILTTYFDEALLSHHETMNMKTKLRALLYVIKRSSVFIVFSYILIQSIVHIIPKKSPPKSGVWEVSESTKQT